MLLEKPAFSPALNAADAERAVSSLLKKNHWNKYDFSGKEIFYIPYWFFSYDIYEQVEKKTNHLSSGFNSLNAFSNEFDKSIAALTHDSDAKKKNELDDAANVHVVSPRLSEDEARGIISVRLASNEGTSKEHVIISGLAMFFVPIWLIVVSISKKKISLRVNAVNGDIENAKAVPRREKGFSELTAEVLEELKTPAGWIEYSTGAVGMISDAIAGIAKSSVQSKKKNKFSVSGKISFSAGEEAPSISNNDIQVIILAMVAIIIILWAIYRF